MESSNTFREKKIRKRRNTRKYKCKENGKKAGKRRAGTRRFWLRKHERIGGGGGDYTMEVTVTFDSLEFYIHYDNMFGKYGITLYKELYNDSSNDSSNESDKKSIFYVTENKDVLLENYKNKKENDYYHELNIVNPITTFNINYNNIKYSSKNIFLLYRVEKGKIYPLGIRFTIDFNVSINIKQNDSLELDFNKCLNNVCQDIGKIKLYDTHFNKNKTEVNQKYIIKFKDEVINDTITNSINGIFDSVKIKYNDLTTTASASASAPASSSASAVATTLATTLAVAPAPNPAVAVSPAPNPAVAVAVATTLAPNPASASASAPATTSASAPNPATTSASATTLAVATTLATTLAVAPAPASASTVGTKEKTQSNNNLNNQNNTPFSKNYTSQFSSSNTKKTKYPVDESKNELGIDIYSKSKKKEIGTSTFNETDDKNKTQTTETVHEPYNFELVTTTPRKNTYDENVNDLFRQMLSKEQDTYTRKHILNKKIKLPKKNKPSENGENTDSPSYTSPHLEMNVSMLQNKYGNTTQPVVDTKIKRQWDDVLPEVLGDSSTRKIDEEKINKYGTEDGLPIDAEEEEEEDVVKYGQSENEMDDELSTQINTAIAVAISNQRKMPTNICDFVKLLQINYNNYYGNYNTAIEQNDKFCVSSEKPPYSKILYYHNQYNNYVELFCQEIRTSVQ